MVELVSFIGGCDPFFGFAVEEGVGRPRGVVVNCVSMYARFYSRFRSVLYHFFIVFICSFCLFSPL